MADELLIKEFSAVGALKGFVFVQAQAANWPRDNGGFWSALLRSLTGGRRGQIPPELNYEATLGSLR